MGEAVGVGDTQTAVDDVKVMEESLDTNATDEDAAVVEAVRKQNVKGNLESDCDSNVGHENEMGQRTETKMDYMGSNNTIEIANIDDSTS